MKKRFGLMLLVLGISASHFIPAASAYDRWTRHDGTSTLDSLPATLAQADSIFGDDYLGPQEIALAFSMDIDEIPVPGIPYSKEELIMYRDMGFMLVLQLDSIGGKPLTMESMDAMYESRMSSKQFLIDKKGMIGTKGNSGTWSGTWPTFQKESFYRTETPRFGWRLVTKNIIPESVGQDYVAQTSTIEHYIGSENLYYGQKVTVDSSTGKRTFADSDEWIRCVQTEVSFNKLGDSLHPLFVKHSKKYDKQFPGDTLDLQAASRMLAGAQFSQLCRERAVEIFYRMILYHAMTSKHLFEKAYVWTCSTTSNGKIVGIGYFIDDGITLDRSYAHIGGPVRGATFCRGKHFGD